MEQKTFIRAMATPWRQGVGIYIGDREGKTKVKDIVLEHAEEGCEMQPSWNLEMSNAQTLMDDLWHAGVRPTEGAGSAGAMRAVENHLGDLRKLVFNKESK